jgi:hypothetical protein
VRFEFTPEPTPEEREALLHALSSADVRQDWGSAWWEAGIREATEDQREGLL